MRQGLIVQPRLTLNLRSSCLQLPSARILSVHLPHPIDVVLRTEPGTSCMLHKHSTPELYSQPERPGFWLSGYRVWGSLPQSFPWTPARTRDWRWSDVAQPGSQQTQGRVSSGEITSSTFRVAGSSFCLSCWASGCLLSVCF